jgi:hypothetical protein
MVPEGLDESSMSLILRQSRERLAQEPKAVNSS